MSSSKIIILFLLYFVSAFCRAESHGIDEMKESEKKFNQRSKVKYLIYMDVETMFPSDEARSLAIFSERGDVKSIKKTVSSGVSVDEQGVKGSTPLLWALMKDSILGFNKLLELGANPNVVFEDGGSIMRWAARNNDIAFLRSALAHGGNPNLVSGASNSTPLFETIGLAGDVGNTEKIDLLFSYGADLNFVNSSGFTPLILAAEFGRFDLVFRLLELGADKNILGPNNVSLTSVMEKKEKQLDHKHELYSWFKKVEKIVAERR